MNMNMLHSCTLILYSFILWYNISTLPECSCQSNSQNIETFYPFGLPPIASTPNITNNQQPSSPETRPEQPQVQLPGSPPPLKSSSNKAVIKAVFATAASTVVISALFFFILQRHARQKRINHVVANASFKNIHSIESHRVDDFVRVGEKLKGMIVDEEGLDVLYWRDLEGGKMNEKEALNKDEFYNTEEEKKVISSKGGNIKNFKPPVQEPHFLRGKSSSSYNRPGDVDKGLIKTAVKQESSVQLSSRSPPPTSTSPPPSPPAVDSFRVDGDLMEALFGSVATNRKSPKKVGNMSSPEGERKGPPSKIFILDPRKSQNISNILRSLSVSRKEIVDALVEGQDLDVDILEKLNKIAPTREEESDILAFNDDNTRLADAESFLYHVLKAVPSAFTRFKAMLFRSKYDSEVIHLKQSLQTLESGCKELRTRGVLPKLLEAVLKAGNRMNAGTSRGNAQAFNLTSLRKLSDLESTDGNTTLLHFVVEEVVRAEGKRCVINRSHSLNGSSRNIRDSGGQMMDNSKSKKDIENEYIMLGLPIVGGISSQCSSVRKAATLDYDALHKACSTLSDHVAEIQKLVGECAISGGGEGFIKEMKSFLDAGELELRVVKKEFTSIMELVKRTTEYYQAGASKDKRAQPLQLFVIVKDFLVMVDQVCIDITRNMQKRKSVLTSNFTAYKKSVKFPLLPANFMSDKSKSISSDSDDDGIVM